MSPQQNRRRLAFPVLACPCVLLVVWFIAMSIWGCWHGRAPAAGIDALLSVVLALCYFSVAICIGLARPRYSVAQLAFFLFLCGAVFYAARVMASFPPPLSPTWIAFWRRFASVWWGPLEWAALYDFSLRFPADERPPRPLRALRTALYTVSVADLVLGLLPDVANLVSGSVTSSLVLSWPPVAFVHLWRTSLRQALSAIALISALIVFTAKYRKIPDASARTRLRWIAFGVAAAYIPISLSILAHLGIRNRKLAAIVDPISLASPALIPITFTYAIVKHRVMGIRLTIRRGVQYLLAKNVLEFVWYLPIVGLFVDILLHPHEPLEKFLFHGSWWFYLLVLVSVSAGIRYRKRLEQWVDKKFFRSAYEEELILSELVERMQSSDTSDEVARVVATTLEEAFKPNGAAVLYRRDETSKFTVSYAHEAPFALQFCGQQDTLLENVLNAQAFPTSYTELTGQSHTSDSAKTDLGEPLVIPIRTASGYVTAVLLLAPKKSEERYTTRDRKLLQAVVTQTGLILEVIALKERIREEGRVRIEVLAKLDKDSIQLILECQECGRCYSGSDATTCKNDGAMLAFTLPIERVIDNKYRLERRIGAGGMGAVYEATDLRLSRIVAVKVLTGRLFGNNQALRRFEREARAAARLQHPNIVPVYDFGPLRGDGAYLVMQRIAGRSWRAELDRYGAIKIARAAGWIEQLCDAMIAAHSSGIIHRDLKPENLVVSTVGNASEKVTVLDFGLAKMSALDVVGDSLTAEECVMGSLAYMSPEQRAGERVDARSDIFSCAVVVIETLSGNRPTQHGATAKWMHESLVWANPTPACYSLKNFFERCLAPVPGERVSSMQRFRRELMPLLSACPEPEIAKAAAAAPGRVSTLPM